MGSWEKNLKRLWQFIWEDDSVWSWIANIVLAFVLIKFIVYPGLGFLLNTSYPVVAVVSESMEHSGNFDEWWLKANDKYVIESLQFSDGTPQKVKAVVDKFYINNNISKGDFSDFPFKNGFNKGDIMVLKGKSAKEINVGDIIVFWSAKKDPIIHRIVRKWQENGAYYFQTKGDNNPASINSPFLDETRISQGQIVGNAVFRIPLLGYIKIFFVDFILNPLDALKGPLLQKG